MWSRDVVTWVDNEFRLMASRRRLGAIALFCGYHSNATAADADRMDGVLVRRQKKSSSYAVFTARQLC